jgi:hypothetical protein
MEIFIFNNQKSGEFGPFFIFKILETGSKFAKKLPGLTFWVTLHRTTQI